jgi:putative endonuclease
MVCGSTSQRDTLPQTSKNTNDLGLLYLEETIFEFYQRFMAKQVGDRGEVLVAQLLKDNGWQIIETQWRCRWGELDLIACDRQWLLFVEVKTRSDRNWDADGSLAITQQKRDKIIKSASAFLAKHPQLANLACRFDVALVRRSSRSISRDESRNLSQSNFHLQIYIEQAFTA